VVDNPSDLEYEVTSRIKKLISPLQKTVGLVTGHGEKSESDQELAPLFNAMRASMVLQTVDLTKPLPPAPPIDALWILGPTQKFKPGEIEALKSWVNSGKSLGILMNRPQCQPAELLRHAQRHRS